MIDQLEGKDVFVTGGTGFIGGHLRQTLAEQDCHVTLLKHRPSELEVKENEDVLVGDVTDPSTIRLDDSFDVIFHLAALTSIEQSLDDPSNIWEVNADGTLHVLEAARQLDVDAFVYVSTASVYGKPEYLPIDESHPPNPREPYGASKLAAEQLALSYESSFGLPTVAVRVFNAFGPGQPGYNVVSTIVEQALSSDEVELGNLSPSRDFIYVEDIINGLVALLRRGNAGEIYNLGRGEDVSIEDLAKTIVSLCDRDIPIESSSDRQRSEGVEIPRHVADIQKMSDLGWTPSWSLEEGLQETIGHWVE